MKLHCLKYYIHTLEKQTLPDKNKKMKKIILSVFTATLVLIACSPKVSPSATAEVIPAKASTKETLISAGQTIFITKCAKCHAPKTNYIEKHTYEESIPVMTSMVKKAHLSTDEIEQVSAYVNSIAKK